MDDYKNNISELNKVLTSMLNDDLLIKTAIEISEVITGAYRAGKKTIFCGNGGSAAEAQHLAAELSGKFKIERNPIPAEACHVNSSFVTAVSNDYDFTKVYARYIEAFCKKGDILIGLSTSGESENVINAFIKAKKTGLITIALTGKEGGKLADYADYLIKIPSKNVPRIQEAHLLIGHIICEKVENELFGKKSKH